MMNGLQEFMTRLEPGEVYRREDLLEFSKSADRYLRELVKAREIRKLWNGVYCRQKMSDLRPLLIDNRKVVETFLKDDDYFAVRLSGYNSLGVGTTQLYRHFVVYNRKRDGRFLLADQHYYFIKSRRFPRRSSVEFMLVDLINNLKMLAEDTEMVKLKAARRAFEHGIDKVVQAANAYGTARTRKFYNRLKAEGGTSHD